MTVATLAAERTLAAIPEHLRGNCEVLSWHTDNGSRVCVRPAVLAIACRHGKAFPTCVEHAGQGLIEAFMHDGDHGRVVVAHIEMAYVTHARNLGEPAYAWSNRHPMPTERRGWLTDREMPDA